MAGDDPYIYDLTYTFGVKLLKLHLFFAGKPVKDLRSAGAQGGMVG